MKVSFFSSIFISLSDQIKISLIVWQVYNLITIKITNSTWLLIAVIEVNLKVKVYANSKSFKCLIVYSKKKMEFKLNKSSVKLCAL